jgi:hypothetical protein
MLAKLYERYQKYIHSPSHVVAPPLFGSSSCMRWIETKNVELFVSRNTNQPHVRVEAAKIDNLVKLKGSTSSCAGYTNNFEWDSVFAAKCVQQLFFW